jgi:hypothetical protein
VSRFSRLLVAALTAAALVAAALVPAFAATYYDDLVAVSTPDGLAAVTFTVPLPATAREQADAGAFASDAINRQGMVGIPSYDPWDKSNSINICISPLNDYEELDVYAIDNYDGVSEARNICQRRANQGFEVDWE